MVSVICKTLFFFQYYFVFNNNTNINGVFFFFNVVIFVYANVTQISKNKYSIYLFFVFVLRHNILFNKVYFA